MSHPYDAAPEFHDPDVEREAVTAPSDYEAAALEPDVRRVRPPAEDERDDTALAVVERPTPDPDLRDSDGRASHPSMYGKMLLGGIAVGRDAEAVDDVAAEPLDDRTEGDDRLEAKGDTVEAQTADTPKVPDEIDSHFGRKVVALADQHTRAILEEDEVMERFLQERLTAELASLRADFAAWEAGLQEPDTDQHFEATGITSDFNELDRPYLPVTLAPGPEVDEVHSDDEPAIPKQRAPEAQDQSDNEADTSLFTWLRGLSDEQLINVLQWSDARTEAISQEIVAQRDVIQRNIREDFGYLVTDGLVPESARETLERGFEQTVEFGAVSSFESGYYHAAGLYYGEEMRLGVKRYYEADEAEKYMRLQHRVLLHEALHGADFANEMGLTYLVSKDEEPLTWVDEATKEHLTLAGMNGQSYVVDPAERKDLGAYEGLRELLHLVLTGGDIEIGIDELTNANYERLDADTGERQALADKLRASYESKFPDLPPGQTILHVIAKEFNAAPKPLKQAVAQQWIEKLYSWRGVEIMSDDLEQATDRAYLGISLGG